MRTVLIDAGLKGSVSSAQECVDRYFSKSDVRVFAVSSWKDSLSLIHRSWRSREKMFDQAILPLQREAYFKTQYWFCVMAMLFIRAKKKSLIGSNGHLQDFLPAFFQKTVIFQPVISMIMLFRLPFYIFRQVICNFILTSEKKVNEFVGFGKGKDFGGIIYWLVLAKKARRYGVFGCAHDTYMGQPLGLHNWPLAVGLLSKLGFRKFIYLSAVLLSIGYGWICWLTGQPTMLFLIPFMLFSTYYLFNINSGTWEPIAWGLAFLSFAAYFAHFPIVAAILLALLLLTHPGVALLTGISLACFSIISLRPLIELMLMGFSFGIFSIWWLFPYRSASTKLGRNDLLNKHSEGSQIGSFSVEVLYQGGIFLLFVCIAFFTAERRIFTILLILPLLFLYYNTRIKWIFSGYTMTNFMLFSGAVYLAVQPTLLSIFAYLLVIYTSNSMLWREPGVSFLGFDLMPITLGETRQKVLAAFSSITTGRIAFEISRNRNKSWGTLAGLGYILADSEIELLNVGYVEIGDYQIFKECCQYFNLQAKQDEFEMACKKAGVQYFVTTTLELSQELLKRGYAIVATSGEILLSDSPNESPITLTIFRLPWNATLIEPSTNMKVSPNSIRFYVRKGGRYVLKYSAFKGWRAFQKGRRLFIEDANPGMVIDAPEDGEVEMRYSLRHYWA